MRYSKEHKVETHARIVKKASVRLREKGAHGIGVADLMKEAGLTHGGFYAHFDSREALVIEAFAYAMDRGTERWRKLAEATPPEKRLATIVGSYLTPLHRDDPASFIRSATPMPCAPFSRSRTEAFFTIRAWVSTLCSLEYRIAIPQDVCP
jgi:AcrR family transcriptional regulator